MKNVPLLNGSEWIARQSNDGKVNNHLPEPAAFTGICRSTSDSFAAAASADSPAGLRVLNPPSKTIRNHSATARSGLAHGLFIGIPVFNSKREQVWEPRDPAVFGKVVLDRCRVRWKAPRFAIPRNPLPSGIRHRIPCRLRTALDPGLLPWLSPWLLLARPDPGPCPWIGSRA